jgi:hypothetical protein
MDLAVLALEQPQTAYKAGSAEAKRLIKDRNGPYLGRQHHCHIFRCYLTLGMPSNQGNTLHPLT